MKTKFNITNVSLGFLGGTFYYAHLCFHLPAGMLIDRYGPRFMTGIGVLIATIGMVIFTYSDVLFYIGLGRFLSGVGAAFMVINIFKITANWFPNQRFTFLIGLTMTLGLMGPLFINFIFSGMITRMGPWDALYIITLFGLVVGVLYVIFARDSREALIHHTKDNKPRHLLSKIGLIIRNPQNWYLAFFYALAFSPLPLFAGLWGSPFLMQEFHASHPEALKGDALLLLGFAIGAPFFWVSFSKT